MLLMGFLYGAVASQRDWFPCNVIKSAYQSISRGSDERPAGRWGKVQTDLDQPGSRDFSQLTGLGYIAGHEPAPDQTGVVVHHRTLAAPGYNFYSSGHAPEAILMDMDGLVMHVWSRAFEEIWPDRKASGGYETYYRRCHLYANGDILAIFDQLGLVRLDRDSNVIWSLDEPVHHDVDVDEDGRIFTLAHYRRKRLDFRPDDDVLDDHVMVVSPDGAVQKRVSLIDAFRHSPFAKVLERVPSRPDIFHTNTIEVLDGRYASRHPAFAKGNVLVSLREIDVVAIVDMNKESIAWLMWGMWKHQHHPTVLDNGNMLVFDNLGHYGFSKVIEFNPLAQRPIKSHPYTEFDPFRQKVIWTYEGNAQNRFFSRFCGTVQRLSNGDTLIVQSDIGRAFEVTADKKIVWEFLNPNRAGDNQELIAVIFEMQRLPLDFPLDWLNH